MPKSLFLFINPNLKGSHQKEHIDCILSEPLQLSLIIFSQTSKALLLASFLYVRLLFLYLALFFNPVFSTILRIFASFFPKLQRLCFGLFL